MPEKRKRNKKNSVLWQLRWYILLIAEVALVLSVIKVGRYKKETAASQNVNEEIAEAVTINTPPPSIPYVEREEQEYHDDGSDAVSVAESGTALETDPGYFPITVDFNKLIGKNPDCVGWLYSAGTPINLAIMQADDNTYYLSRLFDRTDNGYGTIFLDCNGSPGFNDANNLIFGHNMNNGTMFGSLGNYRSQSYYEKHPCLWLATEYRNYRLDVVAGIVHTDDSLIYSTPISRKATDEVVPFAISNSVFKSEAVYNPDAKYVTLSTCCNDFVGARLAIICEMTEIK